MLVHVVAAADVFQQLEHLLHGEVATGLVGDQIQHAAGHEVEPAAQAAAGAGGQPGGPVLELAGLDAEADLGQGVAHPGIAGEEPGRGLAGLGDRHAVDVPDQNREQGGVHFAHVAGPAHLEHERAARAQGLETRPQRGHPGLWVP